MRTETRARQRSPQRSPQRMSQVVLRLQPAPRPARSASSSPARRPAAAEDGERSGQEGDDGESALRVNQASPQQRSVQPAGPAAAVFVCDNLSVNHGISCFGRANAVLTADAATQAGLEGDKGHDMDTSSDEADPSQPIGAFSEPASSSQDAAIAGTVAVSWHPAASTALPGKNAASGGCMLGLEGETAVGGPGLDESVEARTHAEPARKYNADTDLGAAPALDANAEGIGRGIDSGDGATDSRSRRASREVSVTAVTESAQLAPPAADALQPAAAEYVDSPADDGVPDAECGSGSLAGVAQLDGAEAQEDAYMLSEQTLRASEAQLHELAALAAQLQQASFMGGTLLVHALELAPVCCSMRWQLRTARRP